MLSEVAETFANSKLRNYKSDEYKWNLHDICTPQHISFQKNEGVNERVAEGVKNMYQKMLQNWENFHTFLFHISTDYGSSEY